VALGCVEALAELHAKGWAHGDVQPAHLIVGPDHTHLIDLALAHGGRLPECYDFASLLISAPGRRAVGP
jgi:tRNA A-37 threonylcarbamoyl transferase component Bud32